MMNKFNGKSNLALIIGIIIICLILILIMVFLMLPLNKSNKQDNKLLPNSSELLNDSTLNKVIPPPPTSPSPTSTPTSNPSKTPTTKVPSISKTEVARIFSEKKAMVAGDSMAEGLVAYEVLSSSNVVWHRGRRIDNMNQDMPTILSYQPKYLFLTYGSNDLELWEGRVNSFINHYRNTLNYLKTNLPNTKIIINSILPVSEEAINRNNAFSYQELFNNELKKLAEEENIPFLENSSYLEYNQSPFSTDGVHPKAFYYPLWAKNMANYLQYN